MAVRQLVLSALADSRLGVDSEDIGTAAVGAAAAAGAVVEAADDMNAAEALHVVENPVSAHLLIVIERINFLFRMMIRKRSHTFLTIPGGGA